MWESAAMSLENSMITTKGQDIVYISVIHTSVQNIKFL